MGATRYDYCHSLVVSQISDTLTSIAEHTDTFSYDAVKSQILTLGAFVW